MITTSADPATNNEAAQLRAEHILLRNVLRGSMIGALVCAGIWIGLVAIATIGNGTALAPVFAVAAGCGIVAGLFLGGSAGALAGAAELERVEHARMHPQQTSATRKNGVDGHRDPSREADQALR